MDAGALANILRRPVSAAENTAHERVTLSVRLAITVATAQGGQAGLVRELQALAGRFPVIRLVQSPGAAARLEAGSVRLPVPAPLRDALLAAVRSPEAAGNAARTSAAPAVAATLPAPNGHASTPTSISTAVSSPAGPRLAAAPPIDSGAGTGARAALPSAGQTAAAPAAAASLTAAPGATKTAAASLGAAMAASPPVATFAASARAVAHWPAMLLAAESAPLKARGAVVETSAPRIELPLVGPLFDDALDALVAAVRLNDATRASGVFVEAQLARTIIRESDAAAAESGALREPVRVPADLSLADRTAAQLEVLRRDAASFGLCPWSGQKARLDIGREHVDADGAATAADLSPIFFATLQLDLPNLGAVTVRLRLVNSTLAANIDAANQEPWQSALPELAAQLGARGLQAAALVASTDRKEGHDAAGA